METPIAHLLNVARSAGSKVRMARARKRLSTDHCIGFADDDSMVAAFIPDGDTCF
jgi:hypothetical protein